MITTLIFIGYFLWAMILCPIDDCTKVEKLIPKVDCKSQILDREIKHYLDQDESSRDTCYWNLIVRKTELTDMDFPVFEAILYKEEGYDYPKDGNAFIEYGHNVIVIEGTIFKSLFKKSNQVRRSITMYRTRIPYNAPVPHLKINFSENRVLSLYFETLSGAFNI